MSKKKTPNINTETISYPLPKSILTKLESLHLSKINFNHSLTILTLLFDKFLNYHEEFYFLSASYISKLTSDNFRKKFFKLLVFQKNGNYNEGLIICNDSYEVSKNSKGYKINPKFITVSSAEIKLLSRLKNIKEHNEVKRHNNEIIEATRRAIISFEINLTYLNLYFENTFNFQLIERDGVYYYVENKNDLRHIMEKNNFDFYYFKFKKIYKEITLNELKEITERVRFSGLFLIINKKGIPYIQSLFEFENQHLKFKQFLIRYQLKNHLNVSISGANGRLNSLITSFPKSLLKRATLGNEKIVSYDLKASQITILANLMLKNSNFLTFLSECNDDKIKEYLEEFKKVEITEEEEKSIKFFMEEHIQSGDIYEKIAKFYNLTRDESKTLMLSFIYSEKESKKHKGIKEIIPVFYEILKRIKLRFKMKFKKGNSHIAIFMQLIESEIFIQNIYKNLLSSEEYEIPFLTKHDSILFPENEKLKETLEEIIYNFFQKISFQGYIKYDVITDELSQPLLITEKLKPKIIEIFQDIYN